MKKHLLPIVALGGLLLGTSACDSNSDSDSTVLSLSIATTSNWTQKAPVDMAKAGAADSVSVSRARFLLRSIRFKSIVGDSADFNADPLVVELPQGGTVSEVLVREVPPGTYERLVFRVHRLSGDNSEDAPFRIQPDFAEFVEADEFSIIIDGSIFESGVESAFRYRSRLMEDQRLDFASPLIIEEGTTHNNVTIVIDPAAWFLDEGVLMDPRDQANDDEIDQNLKNSIKAIEDADRDAILD